MSYGVTKTNFMSTYGMHLVMGGFNERLFKMLQFTVPLVMGASATFSSFASSTIGLDSKTAGK